MGFAAILWGLPLAALPVIVHLMARRRKKVVHWGAMQFLVAAKQRAKRSWRLRDILLLMLRVLGIAALIFAIAQPSIPISWIGGHEARDVIVIVDESMSTAALDGSKSLFEHEQEALERLFAEKDIDGTDHLRVMMAGAEPEWLSVIPVKADASNRKVILDTISKRKPSLAAADIQASVESALAAAAAKAGLPRHIFVVTDAQAHGWNPEMTGRWAAAHDKIKEFSPGSELRVWPATSDDGETANLAVHKVELAREVVASLEPVMFRATVTNFSTNASGTAILHWLVDGEEIGVITVPTIEPESDATIGFEHSFPTPGVFQVTCRMDSGDVLPVDDEATAIIEVAAGIPVLIVEGDPSNDPLETDSAYLLAALGGFDNDDQGLRVASPFRATLINSSNLESSALTPFKAIVLTNTPPFSEKAMANLEAFVRDGGGLWMALGDQVRPDWFNRELVANGAGLAPLEISAAQGDAEKREKFELVSPPTQLHPATAILSDTDKLDIDSTRIYRRFPFAGTMPRDLSVLLQLDEGSPLVVERRFGNGRVIVQSVPLGASWSNLPLLLSYVAVVHEWLWYLVEPGMVKRNLNAGDPIAFTIDEAETQGMLVVEKPNGLEKEIGRITAGESKAARFAATLNPGLYHAGIRSGANLQRLSSFSVARDPEESNLARLDESQRGKLREAAGLVFGTEETTTANSVDAKPEATQPIWEWLLIGVIAFLISESLLALWISKGRQPTTAGASM